jgi:hypothetical protein
MKVLIVSGRFGLLFLDKLPPIGAHALMACHDTATITESFPEIASSWSSHEFAPPFAAIPLPCSCLIAHF